MLTLVTVIVQQPWSHYLHFSLQIVIYIRCCSETEKCFPTFAWEALTLNINGKENILLRINFILKRAVVAERCKILWIYFLCQSCLNLSDSMECYVTASPLLREHTIFLVFFCSPAVSFLQGVVLFFFTSAVSCTFVCPRA